MYIYLLYLYIYIHLSICIYIHIYIYIQYLYARVEMAYNLLSFLYVPTNAPLVHIVANLYPIIAHKPKVFCSINLNKQTNNNFKE